MIRVRVQPLQQQAAASVLQEDSSPCVLVGGHLDATCVSDQSGADALLGRISL